jgi:uncharacterized membrane protein YhaH (DUF805 family)
MPDNTNQSRFSRKSYGWTILFVLPAFLLGANLGNAFNGTPNEELGVVAFARLTSLVIAVFIVLWTIKRLHDANKSGWWSLLLLPPATLFFLVYVLLVPGTSNKNRWGDTSNESRVFGIKAIGIGRIASITLLVMFMFYLSALYASFLFM